MEKIYSHNLGHDLGIIEELNASSPLPNPPAMKPVMEMRLEDVRIVSDFQERKRRKEYEDYSPLDGGKLRRHDEVQFY